MGDRFTPKDVDVEREQMDRASGRYYTFSAWLIRLLKRIATVFRR